ncbi:arabinofuranosidase catalytic domain-containing protein, partial [Microbispora sp. CSR-4]
MVLGSLRRALAAGASAVIAAGLPAGLSAPSEAATQGPCDIYAAGGTPCVAAHSTTR